MTQADEAGPTGAVIRWSVGLWLVALMALAGCGADKPESPPTPTERKRLPVEVVTVAPMRHTEHYQTAAPALPIRRFQLSAEVSGTLIKLLVDTGDRVTEGQLLARLDPVPLTLARDIAKARLQRARVRVSLAQKAFARQGELNRQGSLADAVLEEAELNVRLAQADAELAKLALAQAERDRSHARISAPASGEITRRFPEVGQVLSPGSTLFHLARTDRIRLLSGLSEAEVVHMREGQSATVSFDALPDTEFAATVVRVGAVDVAGEAAFPVEVVVDNAEGRIRPGMVARVTLPGRVREGALFVPAVALRRDGDRTLVFEVVDRVARRRVVTVDTLVGERALIADGIEAGAQVVVVGQTGLKGGEPVTVTLKDGVATDAARQAPAVYGLP